MAQCQGPRAQIRRFFGLHLYLAEKYCKNLKVPRAQFNVNLARAIAWFVDIGLARGAQGARPPPIELLPMIKMSQKYCCFFSFSFF